MLSGGFQFYETENAPGKQAEPVGYSGVSFRVEFICCAPNRFDLFH